MADHHERRARARVDARASSRSSWYSWFAHLHVEHLERERDVGAATGWPFFVISSANEFGAAALFGSTSTWSV